MKTLVFDLAILGITRFSEPLHVGHPHAGNRERLIGGFGEAGIMSFHATKFLNRFKCKAVLTNDN